MAGAPMGGALREIHRLFAEGTVAGLADGQLLDRFLATGDESAFAALVERHGPMVLGTCRAVLRNADEAEDAFQATFLVLVCKVRSIRNREALGGWLHQVAHRIAVQAGISAARKRRRERPIQEVNPIDRRHADPDEEWRAVLHHEIARLSDRYRLPLLLCDLEGKTHAEAAAALNCGEATVRRRLTGARELLRSRLNRRGVNLGAGGLAATFHRSSQATVPAPWIEATVKTARSMNATAARIAVGEVLSSEAVNLARKSLRNMLFSQLKAATVAAVLLTAFVGLAWGLGIPGQDKGTAGPAPRIGGARTKQSPPPVRAKDEKPANPDEVITYRGRVLDPDGRPFAGAAVSVVVSRFWRPDDASVRATSDAEGRLEFTIPKSAFNTDHSDKPWSFAPVLARAPGFAFGFVGGRGDANEITLQLGRDDVPVAGRIIDLQGQPVPGVTVSVLSIRTPAQGSLDGWLKALEDRKELYHLEHEFLPNSFSSQGDPPIIAPVTSGADGRFLIRGIGRERVATLEIQGSTIETVQVEVRTRPGPTIRVPGYQGQSREESITIYGATFEHAAGPTRPIEGIVRDMDTKRPLAGIMVHGERSLGNPIRYVQAITDAQGHYRLVGSPRGREGYVLAVAPVDFEVYGFKKAALKVPRDEDLPYLRARVKVPAGDETRPVKLDINLKRGVWVTGRLAEEDSGRPVRGQVEYFVCIDNPELERYPAYRWSNEHTYFVAKDGAFRFVAFPGPGVLAARAKDEYIMAVGVDSFTHKPKNGFIEAHPYHVVPTNYHTLAEINPAPGTSSMRRDLLLQRGKSLTLTVLDPEGKPLAGNVVAGLRDMGYWETPPPDESRYTILSLKPGKARTLTVLNTKRRLTGELVLKGDETKPQTIVLHPWGVLTGRIVDAEGQPSGAEDQLYGINLPGGYAKIGKDGRFRVEGLIPDKSYGIRLLKMKGVMLGEVVVEEVKIGPGELKDLGDVLPRPRKE
jgi:RNA polymerase sigma factor (sigma-70 family)